MYLEGGPISIKTNWISMAAIEDNNTVLTPGGRWRPSDCTPRHKVSIHNTHIK